MLLNLQLQIVVTNCGYKCGFVVVVEETGGDFVPGAALLMFGQLAETPSTNLGKRGVVNDF